MGKYSTLGNVEEIMKEIQEKGKSTTEKINEFIIERCKKTAEEASMMTIQSKMALVSMMDPDKWDEFKMGLRKAGYII